MEFAHEMGNRYEQGSGSTHTSSKTGEQMPQSSELFGRHPTYMSPSVASLNLEN